MNISGVNSVVEALAGQVHVEKVFLCRKLPKVEQAAQDAQVPVKRLAKEKLDQLFGPNHQGVGAVISAVKLCHSSDILASANCIVLGDRIQDPGNLGAMVRSCAAFGADLILSEHQSSPVNETVVKASAGTIHQVRIARVANLAQILQQCKDNGFWTTALAGEGAPLHSLHLQGKVVLVVGNEGSGVKDILLRQADHVGAIPMVAGVESLNVSAALAIALYECRRQCGFQ
ncbi:23S rRNA (guanosine(2251)-2'-O)-methyltransferase RlmB [Desulfurispira natronophila]|uniref:23S rRNA (Guanosine2251-2'-O)-methyltransferase n=1 Tax=Desulfurispira natronophila TaxID=682562 RepID=A0A7W8DHB1_9BACT|nr:23S rRNA (guanosine(2251)-2'-O)-methyltransferase RlmB [Desulfurispira natronophila]MBB5022098.1 23S rRNA (guanosine2251-2'-O)-methyltransferase [Desulfurispira natronophila]